MKKALLLSTFATMIALPSFAQQGFYIQGDVSYAKITDGEDSRKGFSPRLNVGYDLGDVRLALDYTHYKGLKETEEELNYFHKYKDTLNSIGFSAIYDFDLQLPIKPYAGVRIALNKFKYDHSDKFPNHYESNTGSKTKTGYGLLLGASYEIMPSLDLDVGYRYNYWGKMEDEKIKTHEFSTGLRYTF